MTIFGFLSLATSWVLRERGQNVPIDGEVPIYVLSVTLPEALRYYRHIAFLIPFSGMVFLVSFIRLLSLPRQRKG